MNEERDAKPQPEHVDSPEAEQSELVELVLADERRRRLELPSRVEGVVVGSIAEVDATGRPLVRVDAWNSTPTEARTMVPVVAKDAGREVALLFESGDPRRPIVMGFMHEPTLSEPCESEQRESSVRTAEPVRVENDGERVVFEAEKEIVLRCGNASITLTRAGKILIRGAYLLTRSSGVNRIQGGSVQIN